VPVVTVAIVVVGGATSGVGVVYVSSVEMLSEEEGAFEELPPLSCGEIAATAAIAVDEGNSAVEQVLILGGWIPNLGSVSVVHLVDLATGISTP